MYKRISKENLPPFPSSEYVSGVFDEASYSRAVNEHLHHEESMLFIPDSVFGAGDVKEFIIGNIDVHVINGCVLHAKESRKEKDLMNADMFFDICFSVRLFHFAFGKMKIRKKLDSWGIYRYDGIVVYGRKVSQKKMCDFLVLNPDLIWYFYLTSGSEGRHIIPRCRYVSDTSNIEMSLPFTVPIDLVFEMYRKTKIEIFDEYAKLLDWEIDSYLNIQLGKRSSAEKLHIYAANTINSPMFSF